MELWVPNCLTDPMTLTYKPMNKVCGAMKMRLFTVVVVWITFLVMSLLLLLLSFYWCTTNMSVKGPWVLVSFHGSTHCQHTANLNLGLSKPVRNLCGLISHTRKTKPQMKAPYTFCILLFWHMRHADRSMHSVINYRSLNLLSLLSFVCKLASPLNL